MYEAQPGKVRIRGVVKEGFEVAETLREFLESCYCWLIAEFLRDCLQFLKYGHPFCFRCLRDAFVYGTELAVAFKAPCLHETLLPVCVSQLRCDILRCDFLTLGDIARGAQEQDIANKGANAIR